MRFFKVLLTDLAGIGLIILAILTGWIPGPGGTPLFLAGLGLLAINHQWARKLLLQVKHHTLKFAEKFFHDHPILMILYDVIAMLLLTAGIIVLTNIHGPLKASASILIFLSLGLFMGNRQRLQRLNKYFRKQP